MTNPIFLNLKSAFDSVAAEFLQCSVLQNLADGKLTVAEYGAIMRQIFHHTRENPQLQAFATVRFRGSQRAAISGFYRHALSEIGHDQLALNDAAACGMDVSTAATENPLPATKALLSFPFYQISYENPVSYLGYLFFLEFVPTMAGRGMIKELRAIGVPENAFSFLHDHTTVDVGHNKAMERYCDQLVQTDADRDDVVYAIQATSYLYAQMLKQAVERSGQIGSLGRAHLERPLHSVT